MDEEFGNALGLGLAGVFGYGPCVERGGIDIKTAARVHHIADDESDEQRKGGDYFEIQQGFATDTTNLFHVVHAGNSGDQGAEDDQRDDHGDQTNEGIAQRLHCDGPGWADIAEDDGQADSDQHLEREAHVEGPLPRRRSRFQCGGSGERHHLD